MGSHLSDLFKVSEMLFHIIFLICLNSCWASPWNLIGRNEENHFIQEIFLRHEEEMKHAPRLDLNHDLPVPAMIAREGYPAETHIVTTEDCYILEMHRIPHGKNDASTNNTRPVVYLQHGLLCSSADWVMGSSDNSLGFLLADAGYDVWLGNYRGNTYSRGHCNLDPDDKQFWRFSWDEHGKYDIPAMIDHIIATTEQEKIFYIGHSMGTTGFMVMANERPEYQDKVYLANFLAPVAFVDHMQSPIRYLAPFIDSLQWIFDYLGGGEFLPSNFIIDWLADTVCENGYSELACESILFLLCGFDQAQLNETMLETITHHTPAGTSTSTVVHYVQEIKSKKFAHYDFGKKGNNEAYGQDHPPEFSIEAVKIPVASYWSQNDWLAEPQDVLRYLTRLPNKYATYEVPFELWNHLDYLWGIDAKTILYPEIIKNMDTFINSPKSEKCN